MVSRSLAVKYALENRWQEAARINKKILKHFPNDIDTLNRLAFSLIKLGKYVGARRLYKKVTSLDKTNPIATKNLRKLETIRNHKEARRFNGKLSITQDLNLEDLFIEEAGKTRTIDLKNVTDKKTLSLLEPGNSVNLVVKRSKIFIQTPEKRYVGMFPDSIGVRLVRFIRGGNEYSAYIKAIDDKNVTVFIREEKRVTRFKNQPSFSSNLSYKFLEGEGN